MVNLHSKTKPENFQIKVRVPAHFSPLRHLSQATGGSHLLKKVHVLASESNVYDVELQAAGSLYLENSYSQASTVLAGKAARQMSAGVSEHLFPLCVGHNAPRNAY